MLRVLMRLANSSESLLLGDFPPSEVAPLLKLLSDTGVSITSTEIVAAGIAGRRYVYEIAFTD